MTLRKEAMVAKALLLLDDVGIDGLTMRRLADALGIQPPTLYWHFPSKQDVLERMADALISAAIPLIDTRGEPDDVLRSVARALRGALLSRRDGARVYAGTYGLGENVLTLAEIAVAALERCGLSPRAAVDAMFNLIHYVLGIAIEEQGFAGRWKTEQDVSNVQRAFIDLTARRFPTLHRCAELILTDDFNGRFEAGLQSFLRGLDARPLTRG